MGENACTTVEFKNITTFCEFKTNMLLAFFFNFKKDSNLRHWRGFYLQHSWDNFSYIIMILSNTTWQLFFSCCCLLREIQTNHSLPKISRSIDYILAFASKKAAISKY